MSIRGCVEQMLSVLNGLIAMHPLACHDVARLISRDRDGELSERERLVVHLHCATCRSCSSYRRHLEFIHKISRSLDSDPDKISHATLPPDAKEKLRRKLGAGKKRL
jgi:anti-sigma factor RsiW